jgi:hypothetical protein
VSDFRGPVRALTSYWYYRDIDLNGIVSMLTEDGVPPTLVADSGAFSAYTAGADVTPRLYGDWLDQWPDLFDYAITLDVINDPDASMRSHLECQQVVGRQLVPVIHYGEPVATLDRYYDLGHRLLALGGLALRDMYSEGKRMRWLIPVFRWAEHHPDVRLHGLGIGAFKQMWKLPWWSVDATSWASGTAYGLTAIFDPERGEMKRYNRADAVSHNERPARLLRARGVDPSVLAGKYVRAWSGAVGADSYRRAEHWIRQRRGPISPPVDPALTVRIDDGTGLRIHLATWSGDIGQLVGATDALSRGGMEKRWIPVS